MALAGDPDVGCGWGTQAFKGKVGVAPKVMAATTNGFLGSQTFGISSGTAGCSQGGMVKAEAQLRMYAGANIDTLASDMAAGQGESLDTLAYLLGISDAFLRRSFERSEGQFYLEQAIRLEPGSELAKVAFAELETQTLLAYSGSSGLHLPRDVQRWLAQLQAIARSAPPIPR